MIEHYFNYHAQLAETPREWRRFLHGWWKLHAADRRWTPPYMPTLRRIIRAQHTPHLARLDPLGIHLEAMPRRGGHRREGAGYAAALFDEPVAAAMLLSDPRRRDGTAYLGLLHVANDAESLDRLLAVVMEQCWARGQRRVIGPTGLSPHLYSGVLHSHFHLDPPLHTAYNPPYLPEVLQSAFQPLLTTHLYEMAVPATPFDMADGPARLTPLAPRRLAQSLLPLLAAACAPCEPFPPPDRSEAAFLLDQLQPGPLLGWLARVERQPVGFVLLQPDLTAAMRRAQGGRNRLWRWWLQWRSHRRATAGRILLGGVLPAWRERGIGHQLTMRALHTGQQMGWRTLTIGPIPAATTGAQFVQQRGAAPKQHYVVYESEL